MMKKMECAGLGVSIWLEQRSGVGIVGEFAAIWLCIELEKQRTERSVDLLLLPWRRGKKGVGCDFVMLSFYRVKRCGRAVLQWRRREWCTGKELENVARLDLARPQRDPDELVQPRRPWQPLDLARPKAEDGDGDLAGDTPNGIPDAQANSGDLEGEL